jgi:hypothetical protein
VAQPRYTQIDIEATPYYHCISRCVRRAFLCGRDRVTGQCFDHRKGWIVEKLAELTDVFSVQICAYAVLSNHFHLVLHVDPARARGSSDSEVVERYGKLFPAAAALWHELPPSVAADRVCLWRARLYDVSWFMRCLNESIARRANVEDGCKGRFWEGRFRSQALLDTDGLLTCMSYVDLNPIRANLAASLEESDFTSIQQRLRLPAAAGSERGPTTDTAERTGAGEPTDLGNAAPPAGETPRGEEDEGRDSQGDGAPRRPELVAFLAPGVSIAEEDALPLTLGDYVELLEATGAAARGPEPDTVLPEGIVRTLRRVGINSEYWLRAVREYRRRFFSMVGSVHAIDVYCTRTDREQAKGRDWAGRVFRDCA